VIGIALLVSFGFWQVVFLASRLSVRRAMSSDRGPDLAAALIFFLVLGTLAANPAEAHESHRPVVRERTGERTGERTASLGVNPPAQLHAPFGRSQGRYLVVRRGGGCCLGLDFSPTTGRVLSENYGYDERGRSVVVRSVDEPEIPISWGERLESGVPRSAKSRFPVYDEMHLLRVSRAVAATKAGGKTEIWRAVEPDELADLIGSGKYRPGPGNEGKYFFPTKAQAKNLADNILPGRKFCITSGCIDSSVLAKIDKIYPAGEGQAWFIPNELLPYIDNIVIHGPA
jgi:hypothetical protein